MEKSQANCGTWMEQPIIRALWRMTNVSTGENSNDREAIKRLPSPKETWEGRIKGERNTTKKTHTMTRYKQEQENLIMGCLSSWGRGKTDTSLLGAGGGVLQVQNVAYNARSLCQLVLFNWFSLLQRKILFGRRGDGQPRNDCGIRKKRHQ